MKFLSLFILLILIQNGLLAQPCVGPGRVPQTAFPVCGTVDFIQQGVPNCTGVQFPNFECQSGISTSNSVWYSFTCYKPGLLSFLITPASPLDDYDWVLMNVTGKTQAQILSNDYSISLNYTGFLGSTGCIAGGVGLFNCPGTSRYNAPPSIEAGNDYLLMVTNFSQSGNGYSISFNGSTADLSNGLDPVITDVGIVGCNAKQLKVTFSEDVLCSSITSNASQFNIVGANNSIVNILSNCDDGYIGVKEIILELQQPLTGGNYSLAIGNTGGSILDVCHQQLEPQAFPFTSPVQTPLAVKSITYEDCKASLLKVVLSKPVKCNTISTDFSEFAITPSSPGIAAIQASCNVNGMTDTLRIFLKAGMSFGSYQMEIKKGSDQNSILDSCLTSFPNGYNFPFDINPRPAPRIDSIQYDKCSPNLLKVYYNTPINCNSISPNGSEYFITGPSAVNIASASAGNCVQGLSNFVLLSLSQRIIVQGNYVLGIKPGSDGNTVSDTCLIQQSVAETVSFNTFLKPSAIFQDNILFGCTTDTISFSHPGGGFINSWQWSFSDGTTANTAALVRYFPATTPQVSAQLIVANNNCKDTLVRNYVLNNAFTAVFKTRSDSFCLNKPLQITNESVGINLQYLWNYGDGNTSSDPNPPPHFYASPGEYFVSLRLSNNHNCFLDSVKKITLVDTPVVRYSSLLPKYCTGDSIRLTAQINGTQLVGYSWSNGNGLVVDNKPTVNFVYDAQNFYAIALTATDKFCGDITYSNTVPIYLKPVVNLGQDFTLCKGVSKLIGIGAVNGYTYLWNTGAATSNIITNPQSSIYSLEADNNGCISTDDLIVTIADTCLIKVPNAFTPNNDGLNDRLRVLNAETATEFNFRIFNRFGQLMFSSNDPDKGWDGTYKGLPVDPGTYVWFTRYRNPFNGLLVNERGASILIR